MENGRTVTVVCHAGTKGMKWGQRLYQYKDGSLTPLGKVRYRTNSDFKTKVNRQQALKKAREAREAKKQYNEEKQKAIKSGSAADVLKFKGDLTKTEMDTVISRLRWEQDMKGISDRELAPGKSKADKVFDNVGKVTDYANTSIKAYNTIANIFNGVKGDHILPKISTNITNDNIGDMKKAKKEKKKEQEAKDKRAQQEAEGPAKREERAKNKAEKAAKDKEPEVWEGTVEDSGKSGKNKSDSSKGSRSDDIIDAEWRDVTPSNLPAVYTNSGRRAANRYLENNNPPVLYLEDKDRG